MKRIICFILTTALCITLGSGYVRADETSEARAQGINVAYHTQDEIRAFCSASGVTVNDALTYSEEPVVSGNYSAGKLSDETLESAVKTLNCVRYIAGISADVQLKDEYNSMTQAAALVNYVNGQLSHYPQKPSDMDEDLYELGANGAGSSNIAWASWEGNSLNWSIINAWMEDGDSSNIDRVGHRRWILNPTMKYTGFGAVSGENGTYSAMYSFDSQNTAADEYGVAWPAQNMPVEYFGTVYPWSVSMGKTVDIASVKVKLTRESDGKTWNFSEEAADGYFNVNNSIYGQGGCIIFRPETDRNYKSGDVYDVDITGLGDGNDVSYSVNFFSLTKMAEPTVKPTEIPTATPTVKPTATPTATPTISPTEIPTVNPTREPVIIPIVTPEPEPTTVPIQVPTAIPTITPTEKPTIVPTEIPTVMPTAAPTVVPTKEPTVEPTVVPTMEPTAIPTEEPTAIPTAAPTIKPSDNTTESDSYNKPAVVKIKKWNTKKNKLTVYFGKVKNASGYQLRYSTDTKFKKNLKYKVISAKSTKTTLTLKKSSRKHYVQIRAYIKKNGKKIYGEWGGMLATIMC